MNYFVDMMTSFGSIYGIVCSLSCCLVCLAIVSARNRNRMGKGLSGGTWALALVFAVYVGTVLQVTGAGALSDIVNMPQGAINPATGKPLGIVHAAFNFVPFSDMGVTFWLNVLMFVPLGVLFPLFGRPMCNVAPTLCFALAFSLLIETSQLITFRAVDVNDLIANVAGAVLGYLVWRVAAAFCAKSDALSVGRRLGERNNGTWRLSVLLVLAAFVGRFMFYWPLGLLSLVS